MAASAASARTKAGIGKSSDNREKECAFPDSGPAGATAKPSEIHLGKGPPPPVAVNPANHLVFNGLMHLIPLMAVRKYAIFFLQTQCHLLLTGYRPPGMASGACPAVAASRRRVRRLVYYWLFG